MNSYCKPLIELQKLNTYESIQRFFIGKLFFPFCIPFQLLIQPFDAICRVDAGPNLFRKLIEGVKTLI